MKKLAIAALLVNGMALSTAASAINLGGVVFNPGDDTFFTSSIQETQPLAVGQTLSGYGVVGTIDFGVNFCPGCELTFTFDNYTLAAVGDLDGDGDDPDFAFTGGTVNFYVDSSPDYNGANAATAGPDGDTQLWLSLAGHLSTINSILGTLVAQDVDFTTGFNFGQGFFDVTGGLAGPNFDTDGITIPGVVANADFTFTSSFQLAGNPVNPSYPVQGTGELTGNSIPEPATLGLLGLGLLGMGLASRRRKV